MRSLALFALLASSEGYEFKASPNGCTVSSVKCYVDDANRILNEQRTTGPLSQEYCAQFCSNSGYSLAGVENGNECYCGNKLRSDAKAATDSDCSVACSGQGFDGEKCGGYWRIGVFDVQCSGPPVPQPSAPKMLNNPCLNASSPFAKQPWCDATLLVDERVKDMVSRMTLDEKIANLDTGAPAIASLGLNAYNWWSEATHGISHVRNDAVTPYESNFAFPITTGMAFNRSLWKATGNQIGREARAFMNAGNAYSTYWAPVINLAREPRWGRNIETPGEDPTLTGEYAAYFVHGFQDSEDDPTHLQASACCKHYVANSMDHSKVAGEEHDRTDFDATITQQDLVDSYLAPFQACVEKGKVSSLMCSYNAVNGVPSCANDWLLQTVARDAWGFDGYITSDCDADSNVFDPHHYTKTKEEAVAAVLHAGTDVDCGGFVGGNAQSALDQKLISEADIDARLHKLFRVRMRLSHFDLARSVAGYYGGNSCDNDFATMVDAVQEHFSFTVGNATGVPDPQSSDVSKVPAAAAMAAAADATILVLGTDLNWAREGHDAVNITLSEGQLALAAAVAKAAPHPIVVVTLTAVPLDLSPLLSNPKVGAILHVGQPSVQTRGAADVLFGAKSPAGRTIQTIYPAEYADGISIFDFNMRPGPSTYARPDCAPGTPTAQCPRGTNPGRTYRFYTGKAAVPFGFGLSYSSFKYEALGPHGALSLAPLSALLNSTHAATGTHFPRMAETPSAPGYAVNVTNTGGVDADDVVLGFLTPPGAGKDGVPLKSLFGFERVFVRAGETVTVWLNPALTDFAFADAQGARRPLAGEYVVTFGLRETAALGMGFAEARLVAHL